MDSVHCEHPRQRIRCPGRGDTNDPRPTTSLGRCTTRRVGVGATQSSSIAFLSSVLPSWRMPVPAMLLPMTPSLDAPLERDEIAPKLAAGPKAKAPTSAGAPTTSPQGPLPSSALSELTLIQSSMSWQAWIVSIWLAGFALFATRILVGLVRSRIAVRSAQEIKNPSWKLLCEGIADQFGIAQRVRLLQSPRASLPVTCGFFRSSVLLPESRQ